jgi:dTDP-glucose pyrophosphorylase
MKGLVPAAGEGTRMRPLTDDRPKGLVPVAGRPLLAHSLDTLVDLGVDALVVVIGYEGAQIREHFGATFRGIPITYVEQAERRGLAHAVALAAPHLDDDFLLMNGDNVCEANLATVRDRQCASDAIGTALVERVSAERAAAAGVFRRDGAGEVVGLVEKPAEPPSRLIPRGFWAFDERIRHACALVRQGHTGERELSAAVDLALRAGWDVETVRLSGWCRNVNTPADREWVERRR